MEGKGSVSLRPWTMEDKEDLARLCNGVDRSYVRNSLPFPYTEKDAEWWIGMTLDRDGKDGVFRAVCLDGRVGQVGYDDSAVSFGVVVHPGQDYFFLVC